MMNQPKGLAYNTNPLLLQRGCSPETGVCVWVGSGGETLLGVPNHNDLNFTNPNGSEDILSSDHVTSNQSDVAYCKKRTGGLTDSILSL